jgi:chromosome segregation ATPase
MMDEKEENETEEPEEFQEIAKEISKLSEEVREIKDNFHSTQKESKGIFQSLNKKKTSTLELSPALEYVNELLENSSEQIISEMKSEFFRLFNFLSSMMSVSSQRDRTLSEEVRNFIETPRVEAGDATPEQLNLKKEMEMLKLLLEERESLIYELSDQLVAIETEKKELKDKMAEINSERKQWENQKEVFERLVTTDPRFNIINLLRRMGVIAPIQLSFVLGVSLSQTRKYIMELEQMRILQVNEDETVSLHPLFNEDTMNVKISKNDEEK